MESERHRPGGNTPALTVRSQVCEHFPNKQISTFSFAKRTATSTTGPASTPHHVSVCIEIPLFQNLATSSGSDGSLRRTYIVKPFEAPC